MKLIVFPILLLIFINTVCADGDWILKFTERDQRADVDIFDLNVYVNNSLVKNFNISRAAHLGETTINLTNIAGPTSVIKLRLVTTSSGTCASSYGAVLLLYNVEVTHNKFPVKFTPWVVTKTKTDFRTFAEDQRLVAQVPQLQSCGLGDYVEFTSQPLYEGTEFVLNNSDLLLSPPAWNITSGRSVTISALVHNIGIQTGSATVQFYVDNVLKSTSDSFTLAQNGETTKNYSFTFNGSLSKVEARVIPTSSNQEGKTENNNAIRYIYGTRPYLLFRNYSDTYASKYASQTPYTDWLSSIQSSANAYLSFDFTNPTYDEPYKCHNLKDLAFQYQKTKDGRYASKALQGLTYMGRGDYTFLNYSRSGTNGVEVYPANGEYEKDSLSYSLECSTSGTGTGKSYHHSVFFPESVKDCALAFDWVAEWIKQTDINNRTNYYQNISDIFMHYANDGYLIAMQPQSSVEGATYPLLGDPEPTSKAGCLVAMYALLPILDYDGRRLDQFPGYGTNPSEILEFCENNLFNFSNNPNGGYGSVLSQDNLDDGLYFEGDYFAYSKHEFDPAIRFYKDVLGINLVNKYEIVKGYENQIPYLMTPKGTFNNINTVADDYIDSLVYYTTDLKSTADKKVANYYIDYAILNNTERYPQLSYSGINLDEKPLLYNVSADKSPPANASYISVNGSLTVLRSDWTRNATQLNLIIHSSPRQGGHGASQQDSLSFSMYAKGDYLVVDSGDPRAIGGSLSCDPASSSIPDDCLAGRIGRTGRGHNTFMIDGKVPGRSGGSTIYSIYEANDNFLGKNILTDKIDYVETYSNITHLADIATLEKGAALTNSVNATREIVFPNHEYFVVIDTLKSLGQHSYSMMIHLGSYQQEGNPPIMGNQNYNTSRRVIGNLSITGTRVTWWNTSTNRPIKYDYVNRATNNITWQTISENNTAAGIISYPVELTISLNPTSNTSGNWSGGRLSGYQGNYLSNNNNDGYHPFVDVKQAGTNVKYLTVYYPRFRNTESAPNITQLTVTGGTGNDYATKITKGNIVDIVSISDGELITTDKLQTNARIGFCRSNNSVLDYLFINDGSSFSYDGTEKFSASKGVLAVLEYDSDRVSGHITGSGSYSITINTGFGAGAVEYVRFNGFDVAYSENSGVITATVSGEGDLEIVGSGPDLEITQGEIFFSTNPWNGSIVNITAQVRNTGSAAAGSFSVKYYDSSTEIGTATVTSLAASSATNRTISWVPTTGGNHTIRVLVDSANTVTETDEGNNNASAITYVGFSPDLIVTPTNITFSNSSPTEGGSIVIYADIANTGGQDVNATIVAFFDGLPATGIPIGNRTALIRKQSQARVNYTWTATPKWTHSIYIQADASNIISESNEDNNLAYKSIYVNSKADMTTNSSLISFNNTSPSAGVSILIQAVVRNIGETAASSFIVRFLDGVNLIQDIATTLAAQSNKTINTTWTATPSGLHNITVILDPTSLVNEDNETNNIANKTIQVSGAGTTTTTTTTPTTTTTNPSSNLTRINMSNAASAHVYDSTNPLDGLGNGYGGMGSYMLIGDYRDADTTDDKYRGIVIFNTTSLGCTTGQTKTLAIFHYAVTGSGWTTINLSLLNMTSTSLAASDYQRTATSANFYQINATTWTDSNDAWVYINITNQWNTAITGGYRYTGIRFDPQWYINDSNEDSISITTTGAQIMYVNCSGSTATTTSTSTTTTTTTSGGTTTTTSPTTTTTTSGGGGTTTTSSSTTTTTSNGGGTTTTTNSGATTTTLAVTTTTQGGGGGGTTTTTMPASSCVMTGNSDPCGEVSLNEILVSINKWTSSQMSLADILKLINSWSDPVTHVPN